ncbi:MAG: type IV secretion system DNA-binding domain-containing protein, partial [Bryobacteraceae bacterium]
MKLYLDKRTEAQNMLVCGAPGTRKSSLLRSLAEQAMARGWPVIFTDLKREYVAEFYRPEVDYLFNAADDRCFHWQLEQEFTDPVGAKSLVSLLIPHEEHSSPFFLKGSRRILAHLFSHWRLNTSQVKAA